MWNCKFKRNANVSKEDISNIPKIIAIIPTTILIFKNVFIFLEKNTEWMTNDIPKKNKLKPTIIDVSSTLIIGNIMKIKPKIKHIIPYILSKSI